MLPTSTIDSICLYFLPAGNGPSAIFLSLMLSGFTPCYNGAHPNPYLAAKLGENPDQSLIDQVRLRLCEALPPHTVASKVKVSLSEVEDMVLGTSHL